jgi:uncharacterized membrane protein YidH (DUF202 family)
MSNKNEDDPAVVVSNLQNHLANERTFLSWVRTSIGIMAFGFVVEKFSLFLKQIKGLLLSASIPVSDKFHIVQPKHSEVLGVALVAFGSLMCLFAFIKYKSIDVQIKSGTYKPTFLLDLMLTGIILLIGLLLTIFLVNTF